MSLEEFMELLKVWAGLASSNGRESRLGPTRDGDKLTF